MGLTLAMFEVAPAGGTVPSAAELERFASRNASAAKATRVELMNAICDLLGIPHGGWEHSQSRLFVKGDVRIISLLRSLSRKSTAEHTAQNLQRTMRFVDADAMLTLTTAARENDRSIGAVGTEPVETWTHGGLDYLGTQKDKLGLPRSITDQWKVAAPFESPETHKIVHPAEIPARDQVLAYAAQMNASFRNCINHLGRWRRQQNASDTLRDGFRVAMLVWKAYAFLAPGGAEFSQDKSFEVQAGRGFGCFTALTYLSKVPPVTPDPNLYNRILSERKLDKLEWVRIAKARVAEAMYLERLLFTTRDLLEVY